ncbi:MAG: 6-phosphogluconolactonase, partial [Candidatus Binatia bacterium]
ISDRCAVALSGGSTPKSLYRLLATPKYRREVPWRGVHFFWGDERCVPPDHPDSNYRMAEELLLSKVKVSARNIHRMAGEKAPEVAAAEYENELIKFFHLAPNELPTFHIVLLGLGEDGHTASLFPGSAAASETERLVVAARVDKLNAHRLTLTLPVLNHAERVIFLVEGKSKAAIVKEILGTTNVSPYPAAQVKHAVHVLEWLVTKDAAGEIIGPMGHKGLMKMESV